jgi:hypothetical protein
MRGQHNLVLIGVLFAMVSQVDLSWAGQDAALSTRAASIAIPNQEARQSGGSARPPPTGLAQQEELSGDWDGLFFAGGGTERFFNIAQIGPLTVLRQVPLITNAINMIYIRGGEPFITFSLLDPNDHSLDPGLSDLFADGVTFSPGVSIPAKHSGRPPSIHSGPRSPRRSTRRSTRYDRSSSLARRSFPSNPRADRGRSTTSSGSTSSSEVREMGGDSSARSRSPTAPPVRSPSSSTSASAATVSSQAGRAMNSAWRTHTPI